MAFEPTILGRSGLTVGRIGIGAAYGVPAVAVEEAIEHGCNYLYYGSMRRSGMADAIRNVAPRMREKLVVVVQIYTRLFPTIMRWRVESALRDLKLDYADVLLYGWYNSMPPQRLIDLGLKMKAEGKVKHLALSTHHRPFIPQATVNSPFEIFHVRYNAVHHGAETDVFPLLPKDNPPGLVAFTATCWGKLLRDDLMPPGAGTPTASHCYQFALSHPSIQTALCGPRNREQMREALKALELGPLTEEELTWMRRIGDHIHG